MGMRRILPILLFATLVASNAWAQAGEPVKPYVLFIMDSSGSMDYNVADSNDDADCYPFNDERSNDRLTHAKCALQGIVNAYGDVIIGLAKFAQVESGNNTPLDCVYTGSPCGTDGDSLDLLVPLVDENANDVLEWIDFSGDTCDLPNANDPEIYPDGGTPLGGALDGTQRYFQGLDKPNGDPYWTGAGDSPISDDPLNEVFIGGVQCRPYLAVLLTDGSEQCGGDAPAEATALLTTPVTVNGTMYNYRIETKPIGLGISPGNSAIEAIAHGGGATDVAGENEGFYAENEEQLSAAFASIISENLRFETCNDLDDDCDVLIDEDFPAKGTTCSDGALGACESTGTFQCTGDGTGLECVIDNPGDTPQTEVCNGVDDDCDGLIDEDNVCQGCTGVELCNNLDDDCDGNIDENLTRDCGSDVGECTPGQQICTTGNWGTCSGTTPVAETCNGLDDDCDGTVDGFSEPCTNLPEPPGNPNQGICRPGMRVCNNNSWSSCTGETVPDPSDPCDGLDNDCDGSIDEEDYSADCQTACGTGNIVCDMGNLVCQQTQMPEPEECNGLDDDCDGVIDESVPTMGDCDPNGDLCTPGTLTCLGGTFQCVGGTQPDPEVCDCVDNDCDGDVDEGVLCSGGASCVECQCAAPCGVGEFACPRGKYCDNGFCLDDPCFEVDCPPQNGDQYECVEGTCERSCDLVSCPAGFVCLGSSGQCVLDNCDSFPEYCDANELCIAGTCEPDPCAGVSCQGEQFCRNGQCIDSCAGIQCPAGESCDQGTCAPNPCPVQCVSPRVCNEELGECVPSPCVGVFCGNNQVCDDQTGECVVAPCAGVDCPDGQVCSKGNCFNPDEVGGGEYDFVSPGGGGCHVDETPHAHAYEFLLFILLPCFAALFFRRRHARVKGRGKDSSDQ